MSALYVLDVPENRPVAEVAARDRSVSSRRVGPYFELVFDRVMVIDRRATGCRHAVWYSSVAGTRAARITQWDKDVLRIEAA
ncbi:hypothetical protein [Kutzneria sp. NPDC052558]|uniref:hypothetical protein n=1 Tax=Kutzneria sp. NPDC052558 TaxID=3364121 RepID=UPI0037C55CB4